MQGGFHHFYLSEEETEVQRGQLIWKVRGPAWPPVWDLVDAQYGVAIITLLYFVATQVFKTTSSF